MFYLYNTYNNVCNQTQNYLESYIPEASEDMMKGALKSLTYSFTVSILLSDGKLIAGLSGGGLAIFAIIIHEIFMIGIKKFANYASHRFDRPVEPIGFEGNHCAFMLGWGGALYSGHALRLGINYKASFLLTIPLYIWNTFNPMKTPLIGTVVI